MHSLPQTGTSALLQTLSPHLEDDFICDLFPRRRGSGRRPAFSPHQLLRVLLLALLTPAHSFNLLVKLLRENRAWRDFALLPNKHTVPGVRILHEFRGSLDVARLRALNGHLLGSLLAPWDPNLCLIHPWFACCPNKFHWDLISIEKIKNVKNSNVFKQMHFLFRNTLFQGR
jgi:hypothetical protein